jgi:hypothetical protein
LAEEICFDARPHLLSSPPGEEITIGRFHFADDRPANPVVRIFKQTENDSPSPWGEGRVEGGRYTKLQPRGQVFIEEKALHAV